MAYGDRLLPPRFWDKVEERVDGCWQWTGALSSHGYGRIWWGLVETSVYAHRLAFAVFRDGLTDGKVIDHLCRNRACVNPAHMEEVTLAENIRRGDAPGMQRWRTDTCQNGHDLREGYVTPAGSRRCRKCQNANARARAAAKRAAS